MSSPSETQRPQDSALISVVVPVWREHDALAGLLPLLATAPEVREVIVSAAEPDFDVQREVEDFGATMVNAGRPNRGRQLDLGAARSSGAWLLFHHADSRITGEHLAALGAVNPAAFVGGAFYRRFDERHPALRWLEPIERWHNRSFGALFGDQSIFVRRERFFALGGFRGLPLMEDVDFSLRLRRSGRVILLDPPIASSPRKHLAQGPWRTTMVNAILLALYRCGVSPERLHAWYYRTGRKVSASTTVQPDSLASP
jgi:rSAM/selenodomain-associated transferase 2